MCALDPRSSGRSFQKSAFELTISRYCKADLSELLLALDPTLGKIIITNHFSFFWQNNAVILNR